MVNHLIAMCIYRNKNTSVCILKQYLMRTQIVFYFTIYGHLAILFSKPRGLLWSQNYATN